MVHFALTYFKLCSSVDLSVNKTGIKLANKLSAVLKESLVRYKSTIKMTIIIECEIDLMFI